MDRSQQLKDDLVKDSMSYWELKKIMEKDLKEKT